MVQYKKENGRWLPIEETREKETVNSADEKQALDNINIQLDANKLKPFIKEDAPTDYILKLIIPRYYNNGEKVSPDVIAEIFAQISDALGGASTWAGRGFWIDNNKLYEDKNIFVEVLLKSMSPDRAIMLSKYIGSSLAKILKQEGALTVIVPALADFISSKDYDKNIEEAPENIKTLNDNEEKEKNTNQTTLD